MKPFGYPVHVSGDEPSGKPDAGDLHVRFDEGEGIIPPYSTDEKAVFSEAGGESRCGVSIKRKKREGGSDGFRRVQGGNVQH
jgi:hypothetical protein